MSKLFPTSLPREKEDPFPPAHESLTGHKKSEARLCAMQALYQHMLTELEWTEIAKDFNASYLKQRKASTSLFEPLSEALKDHWQRYSEIAAAHISETWTWERLPLITKALLITGVCELEVQPETGTGIVVSDYIKLAQGYLPDEEMGFVNACLDACAKQIRS
jgi:N utilization substance protein B